MLKPSTLLVVIELIGVVIIVASVYVARLEGYRHRSRSLAPVILFAVGIAVMAIVGPVLFNAAG